MNLFFSCLGVCCQCAGPGVRGSQGLSSAGSLLGGGLLSLKNPPTLLWPPYPVTSVISGIPGRIKVPVVRVRVYCGSEIPTVPYRSRYRGTTVGIHSSVGISSHLVARYEDTFLYLLSSALPGRRGILVAISSESHLVARYKIPSYTCSCPIALRL